MYRWLYKETVSNLTHLSSENSVEKWEEKRAVKMHLISYLLLVSCASPDFLLQTKKEFSSKPVESLCL